MTEKNGTTALAEKKPAQTWEWETAHGPVKLDVNTVLRYFNQKASQQEVIHFLAVAKYHRLNPWLREIFLVTYEEGEPAAIVVAKDGILRRASEFPQYRGFKAGIYLQTTDKAGAIILQRREGGFYTEKETVIGGWCEVSRNDRDLPILVEVPLKECIKRRRDGTPTRFWKDKEGTMIRKVAIARAHREAFPAEFEGILDESEVGDRPEPLEIQMPVSNQEAQSSAFQGAGVKDGPATVPGVNEGPATPADETPSPEEQAAIRERELAEAKAQEAAQAKEQIKTPRIRLGELLTAKAKKSGESYSKLLRDLTGKGSVTELSDTEARDALVRLI